MFILYLVMSIICVKQIIGVYYREKLSMHLAVCVGFSIYYVFIPTFYLIFRLIDNIDSQVKIEYNLERILISFIFSLVFWILYNTSYRLSRKNYIYRVSQIAYPFLKVLFVLFLVTGSLSLVITVSHFGGFVEVLRYTEAIRAYGIQYFNVPGYLTIFKTLSSLLLIPPFIILFIYKKNWNGLQSVIVVISFIAAMYFLIFNAGRAELLIFILIFVTLYVYLRKISLAKIFFFGVVAIVAAFYLDTFFWKLSYGSSPSIPSVSFNLTRFLSEFMFPFRNLINSDNINSYAGFSMFKDFYMWIFDLIPQSLFQIEKVNYRAPYEIVTMYYNKDSNLLGGIPIDLITLFYRQLGLFSLMILSVIFGLLTSFIDGRLFHSKPLLKITVFYYTIFLVAYADPVSNVRNRINYVFVLLFIVLFFVKSSSRKDRFIYDNIHI